MKFTPRHNKLLNSPLKSSVALIHTEVSNRVGATHKENYGIILSLIVTTPTSISLQVARGNSPCPVWPTPE